MGIIIAVDIGGTQLRVASFEEESTTPDKVHRIPTHAVNENVFDRLTAAIDFIWPQAPVSALSVACPGPLDPSLGIIHSTPNIPGWNKFPLKAKLETRFHIPVFLENDANLAALGEWSYGIGRGYDDLIYFTISTGIGGGVISRDRLLLGAKGLAAELGHITVLPDGPLCSCGQRGHLEALASGPGIANYVNERLQEGEGSILKPGVHLSARQVADAAHTGDRLAIQAFERAGHFLGRALADFLHIFNPSIVIFGGGVSQSSELLFEPMKASVEKHIMDPGYIENLAITTARLGDDAGLLGALAFAQMKLSKPKS